MRASTASSSNSRPNSLTLKGGDSPSAHNGQFQDRYAVTNKSISTNKSGSFVKPSSRARYEINLLQTLPSKSLGFKKSTQKSTFPAQNSINSHYSANPESRYTGTKSTAISKSTSGFGPDLNHSAQTRLPARTQPFCNTDIRENENMSINRIPVSPISIKRAMSPQMVPGLDEIPEDGSLWGADSQGPEYPEFKSLQIGSLTSNHMRRKDSLDQSDQLFCQSYRSRAAKDDRTSPYGLGSLKSITDSTAPKSFNTVAQSLNDNIDIQGAQDCVSPKIRMTSSAVAQRKDTFSSSLPYRSMSDVNKFNKISPVKTISSMNNAEPREGILKSPATLRRENTDASLKTRSPMTDKNERVSSKTSKPLHRSPTTRLTTRDDNRNNSTLDGVKAYLSKLNSKFDISFSTSLKQIFTPSKRIKCSCEGGLDEDQTCGRAIAWITKKYSPNEFEYLRSTYEKILSENRLINIEHQRQIQKDLTRTYPQNKYFSENSAGIKALERILNTFAKYDPQIGYVQGMNFIAASILYHAEEYLAFWLLVMIFEIFEMRDIYLPKLPGLSKHCQIIDMLIFNYQPTIYKHLCKHEIRVDVFCTEWILALFASVVPVENMANFYDILLGEGWPFFYKIILAFLQQFDKQIKEQDDLMGILTVLKSQNHIIKNSIKDKNSLTVDWNQLFQKAQKMDIDSHFIYKMHSNFDVDNQWFRTSFLES